MKTRIISVITIIMLSVSMMSVLTACNDETKPIERVSATPAPSGAPYIAPGPAEKLGEKDTLKVLAIGNSFSQDPHFYFRNMVEECADVELVSGLAFIGGTNFEQQWGAISGNEPLYTYEKTGQISKTNQPILPILQEEEWDYIVMQQLSDMSGYTVTMRPFFKKIIEFLNENCPSAEIVYQQTWAYHSKATYDTYINNYDGDQETMYSMICDAVKEICAENGVKYIIPSGTAIQFARRIQPEEQEYTSDHKHLNFTGKYVAGLTWFEFFTGIDARTVDFDAIDVPDEIETVLKHCAHVAVCGGDYENAEPAPAVVSTNVKEKKMKPVGDPVYKYDFESADQEGIIANLWNQPFEVAPAIVNTEGDDSTSSVYMKGNSVMAFTNREKFLVEPDTNYILKFTYKGGLSQIIPYMNDGSSSMGNIELPDAADDWEEVAYQFKTYKNIGDGALGLRIIMAENAELWIDNVELYKAAP